MMVQAKVPAYPSPLVRYAVSRLPPEILGEIFLHCLPLGKRGTFSTRHAPWLLTKVCRSWRKVALSTPLLWSRFPSSLKRNPGGRWSLGVAQTSPRILREDRPIPRV
ncbi:hypothetical protein BD779DRAFT_249504 [Infundibulicybe gibba]|nr:hypothetical protein BD779DRAFT_249504 [Infundibulicybe gibba]